MTAFEYVIVSVASSVFLLVALGSGVGIGMLFMKLLSDAMDSKTFLGRWIRRLGACVVLWVGFFLFALFMNLREFALN